MTSYFDAILGQPLMTGGVLAIGNFDGVHRGHEAVMAQAQAVGRTLHAPAYVLTFEPHPHAFFAQDKTPFLITTPTEKRRLLRETGMDGVITLSFSQKIADMTPQEFVQKVLIDACQIKAAVVGEGFVFGHERAGSVELLREVLEPRGVGVQVVAPERDKEGEVISSTRIRAALRDGNMESAATMLGRPFSIQGSVQKGSQRGRVMDYPTANIDLGVVTRPRYGVYAVLARQAGEELRWPGVANLGIRPTFEDPKEVFEFHLFDFFGSIYDSDWDIQLLHFLRPEQKFADMAALKAQIERDADLARRYLLSVGA